MQRMYYTVTYLDDFLSQLPSLLNHIAVNVELAHAARQELHLSCTACKLSMCFMHLHDASLVVPCLGARILSSFTPIPASICSQPHRTDWQADWLAGGKKDRRSALRVIKEERHIHPHTRVFELVDLLQLNASRSIHKLLDGPAPPPVQAQGCACTSHEHWSQAIQDTLRGMGTVFQLDECTERMHVMMRPGVCQASKQDATHEAKPQSVSGG